MRWIDLWAMLDNSMLLRWTSPRVLLVSEESMGKSVYSSVLLKSECYRYLVDANAFGFVCLLFHQCFRLIAWYVSCCIFSLRFVCFLSTCINVRHPNDPHEVVGLFWMTYNHFFYNLSATGSLSAWTLGCFRFVTSQLGVLRRVDEVWDVHRLTCPKQNCLQ